MSDAYGQGTRTEQRIDSLQNQFSDMRATVARLEERTLQIYEQNRLIINQLDAQGHSGASLSSTLLSWIALALIVGVAVIFASVYLGAYR
jgi:TolA-binding protein